MIGHRFKNNDNGYLVETEVPGGYGRVRRTLEQVHGSAKTLWWMVTAPDGSSCILNPEVHTITEHEDQTITVFPSIITSTWHGWLRRGVWESV